MWNNGLDEEDLQHEGGGRELEGNWEYFVFLCRYIYIEGIRMIPTPLRTPHRSACRMAASHSVRTMRVNK